MDVESKRIHSWLEQHTPVISILARPRQDDCCEFETTLEYQANLGYTASKIEIKESMGWLSG